MSATADPTSVAPAQRWPWLVALLAGERTAWMFVGKSVLAIYITAWLAMRLQLEQPATAMITVALVMHPHSGMVLAKSFYRALGTLAGSLFGLVLMACFPQQRELFLLSLSLWVGLCAGGAMLYRNFMSYGFVLAGYTAAIVTLPVISHPLAVFDSAVMRVSEVMLGIFVAGVVSDTVFPERLRAVLRQKAREHFAYFIDFVRGSTAGSIPRSEMEQSHLRFVRTAVELEDLRASVIFEDPEARARSSRMQLLNQRYMEASTSFQSAHHLINRLQRHGHVAVVDALIALYAPICVALSPEPGKQYEPVALLPRMQACAAGMPALATRLRSGLQEQALQDAEALLEFDTGEALLQRFAHELCEFVALESALRDQQVRGRVARAHFRRGNDYVGAAITVLRTFLTMASLSAMWLISGWTYGASAMLLATIFSGLFAAMAYPIQATFNTLKGYAAGMLGAFVVSFWLLPGGDGFVMLMAAATPLLLLGPYLVTRTTLPGVGVGYTLGFVYILALKNPMVYDPVRFLNDGIAQLAGLALAGAVFVFIPAVTGSGSQRRRQLQQLRQQVVIAATASLDGLLHRFESTSRDVFHQIVGHTLPGSDESRDLLAWAFSVHESGRAVIELRQALLKRPLPPAVQRDVQAAIHALAQLYRAPDGVRWRRADQAIQHAVDVTSPDASPEGRRVLAHLHLLRSVLRDEQSVLSLYVPPASEPSHAS